MHLKVKCQKFETDSVMLCLYCDVLFKYFGKSTSKKCGPHLKISCLYLFTTFSRSLNSWVINVSLSILLFLTSINHQMDLQKHAVNKTHVILTHIFQQWANIVWGAELQKTEVSVKRQLLKISTHLVKCLFSIMLEKKLHHTQQSRQSERTFLRMAREKHLSLFQNFSAKILQHLKSN